MGRYPVDVTTILVGLHAVLAVFACVLFAAGATGVLGYMQFDSAQIWYGAQLWRFATYAFVHPPSMLLWFAIEMYMLFAFGREVERFIGQRAYVVLYLLLLLMPPLVLTIWGISARTQFMGSPALHFGVFIAFTAIYPAAELFLRITAKWTAAILAAIYTLQLLAYHAFAELAVVWTSIAVAFLFVQSRGAGPGLDWWENLKSLLQPKPKFKVVPKPTTQRSSEPQEISASIDPILDKIAKSGIGSLTAGERQALDRARERLLKGSD